MKDQVVLLLTSSLLLYQLYMFGFERGFESKIAARLLWIVCLLLFLVVYFLVGYIKDVFRVMFPKHHRQLTTTDYYRSLK